MFLVNFLNLQPCNYSGPLEILVTPEAFDLTGTSKAQKMNYWLEFFPHWNKSLELNLTSMIHFFFY